MGMNNIEIRQEIFARNIKKFQVAAALGVDVSTLSRWLQTEMKPERKARVLEAISKIKM